MYELLKTDGLAKRDPREGQDQTRRQTGATVSGEGWNSLLPLIDQGGGAGEDGQVQFGPGDQ